VEEVNLLIYDKSNRPNAEMFWGDAVYYIFTFTTLASSGLV
jgi:hypothetical protein